jgi:hypothetical protein
LEAEQWDEVDLQRMRRESHCHGARLTRQANFHANRRNRLKSVGPHRMLATSECFLTAELAEQRGMNMARKWIDEKRA